MSIVKCIGQLIDVLIKFNRFRSWSYAALACLLTVEQKKHILRAILIQKELPQTAKEQNLFLV